MADANTIKKYMKKAGFDNVTEYTNGFMVKIPWKKKVVDLYVLLKDTSISLRCKGLKITGGDQKNLFRHLLRLNNHSLAAKWGINENGAIFVGHDRLLKDLDFSEFYAATDFVISEFEDHFDELKKYIE